MSEERELAIVERCDFGYVYNGFPGAIISFRYDGGGQGIGSYFMLDTIFMYRFLKAVGSETLSGAVGKFCWVTHTHSEITKIEPPMRNMGKPFDIAEWKAWQEEHMPKLSLSEVDAAFNQTDTDR